MKKYFMTLVAIMALSISAYAAQSVAPAAQKDEMPTMTMTMCDKMGTADCPMGKTMPGMAGDAKGQMPANCPMGDPKAQGQCQMNDSKCQTNCTIQSLVDVIKLQEKLVVGVRAGEKKKLVAEIDKKIAELESMIGKMQKMPNMQMPCTSQMPCAQPSVPAAPQAPAK